GRVFALFLLGAGQLPHSIDAGRHRLERLDPVRYLASSYYERWLAVMEEAIIEAGNLTRDEIETRMRRIAANPGRKMISREDPARAEGIAAALRAGRPVTRKIRKQPRFTIGGHVITRNLNPHGHTRLPRYARGKRGVIVLHHGAHVFPDTNAHGLGENPQHLYTVRIAARELWGTSAEPKTTVLIDLWESYLEDDRTAKPRSAAAEAEPKAVAARVSATIAKPKAARPQRRAAKARHKGKSR
ncbi:MAG: nitrile hydratase subunit beta, partial [Candidatus Binataceae bacterium]